MESRESFYCCNSCRDWGLRNCDSKSLIVGVQPGSGRNCLLVGQLVRLSSRMIRKNSDLVASFDNLFSCLVRDVYGHTSLLGVDGISRQNHASPCTLPTDQISRYPLPVCSCTPTLRQPISPEPETKNIRWCGSVAASTFSMRAEGWPSETPPLCLGLRNRANGIFVIPDQKMSSLR